MCNTYVILASAIYYTFDLQLSILLFTLFCVFLLGCQFSVLGCCIRRRMEVGPRLRPNWEEGRFFNVSSLRNFIHKHYRIRTRDGGRPLNPCYPNQLTNPTHYGHANRWCRPWTNLRGFVRKTESLRADGCRCSLSGGNYWDCLCGSHPIPEYSPLLPVIISSLCIPLLSQRLVK